jgi:N-methylhydantoinase A/oxoprolinase/acetone carboxylase beta subunit
MRRIGIDVGGTNTDAVLLEVGRFVHAVKTPTTPDVTTGIGPDVRASNQLGHGGSGEPEPTDVNMLDFA